MMGVKKSTRSWEIIKRLALFHLGHRIPARDLMLFRESMTHQLNERQLSSLPNSFIGEKSKSTTLSTEGVVQ
jgi:hypothetical protein